MKPSDYIKKGWCQGASAKDGDGIVTHPESPTATSWCLTGAIHAAYPEDIQKRSEVYRKLHEFLFNGDNISEIPNWNDDKYRKQTDVIRVLEQIGE